MWSLVHEGQQTYRVEVLLRIPITHLINTHFTLKNNKTKTQKQKKKKKTRNKSKKQKRRRIPSSHHKEKMLEEGNCSFWFSLPDLVHVELVWRDSQSLENVVPVKNKTDYLHQLPLVWPLSGSVVGCRRIKDDFVVLPALHWLLVHVNGIDLLDHLCPFLFIRPLGHERPAEQRTSINKHWDELTYSWPLANSAGSCLIVRRVTSSSSLLDLWTRSHSS